MGVGNAVDRYFLISKRGSTIWTEVRAGVASFLTISYCIAVNPQIMGQCGIAPSDVVVATATASAVATILVGLLGNLPFGLAPGMGLSAYLTYGLVVGGLLTTTQALTCCAVSGILLAVLTLTGLSNLLMRLTPHHIKLAIVVGMGLLIALIGLVQVDIVVASGDSSLVALGDMSDWKIWLVMGGLALIGTLTFHQIEGGILVGIVSLSVVYWFITGDWPQQLVQLPAMEGSVSANIDFATLSPACIMPILALLFVALFDISGVMFGLVSLASLSENGNVPKGIWGFLSSSVGTVIAAAMGCSPIIICVESAAGVKEGGRTGLVAVTIGSLFLLSLFLAPLFGAIPNAATAPVLILVGAMMMNESKNIDWHNMQQALPSFLCIAMMPFTYSIPNGILFGIGFSLVFYITTGEFLQICRRSEHEDLDRKPSLHKFGDKPVLARNPSLLLSKTEADEAEIVARKGEQVFSPVLGTTLRTHQEEFYE